MDRLAMLNESMNINMMLDFLESLLEATGGMNYIRRAIESNDLAATVQAATRALHTIGIPNTFQGHAYVKSAEMSNKFRLEGNQHYQSRNYRTAILCYNKALAYAPNYSPALTLAYGNISAVLLTIKAYEDCRMNILAAMELDCPHDLMEKLERRLVQANEHIDDERARDMELRSEDLWNYLMLDVERNPEINCASRVCVVRDNKIVAGEDIGAGTMVALERAFVSFQDEMNEYGSCYYCHKMNLFFIPCKGCCKALFCSTECLNSCYEAFHRIECQIVAHMNVESYDVNQHFNKLATRSAIKLKKELSWEEMRNVSLEMGHRLLLNSDVQTAHWDNNPVSILCYDDRVEVPDEVLMNRSLVCAMTVHWLSQVPDFLPTEAEQREQAIDTLSRIILHLNTTFMRQIAIVSSAIDYSYDATDERRLMSEVQRNIGWFSFTSKLPHSCEPNLLVVGFNDTVALVALQRIEEGDELSISYIEHFYDMNILPCPVNSRIRQKLIFKFMEITCECRVCELEWHSDTQEEARMTERQSDSYNRYQIAMNSDTFLQKINAISEALDELTGCNNTIQHRNLYKDFRKILNICQCAYHFNKSYGCVQSLHQYHRFEDYL